VLAIYLNWLKSGHTQSSIADHFNINQQDISRYSQQARSALLKDFVVNNLGKYK
jgi:DNA-binding transcriptional regulator LsrR (DeoR family)